MGLVTRLTMQRAGVDDPKTSMTELNSELMETLKGVIEDKKADIDVHRIQSLAGAIGSLTKEGGNGQAQVASPFAALKDIGFSVQGTMDTLQKDNSSLREQLTKEREERLKETKEEIKEAEARQSSQLDLAKFLLQVKGEDTATQITILKTLYEKLLELKSDKKEEARAQSDPMVDAVKMAAAQMINERLTAKPAAPASPADGFAQFKEGLKMYREFEDMFRPTNGSGNMELEREIAKMKHTAEMRIIEINGEIKKDEQTRRLSMEENRLKLFDKGLDAVGKFIDQIPNLAVLARGQGVLPERTAAQVPSARAFCGYCGMEFDPAQTNGVCPNPECRGIPLPRTEVPMA